MRILFRVGFVAEECEQSDQLCQLLEQNAVKIVHRVKPDAITDAIINADNVNVWILDLDEEHWHDNVDKLIENAVAPLFFNDPSDIDHQQHVNFWVENLISRLMKIAGVDPDAVPLHSDIPPAKVKQAPKRIPYQPLSTLAKSEPAPMPANLDKKTRVWVLGASLGGPAAVKRFLHSLPKNLNIAFILVQHIDHNFLDSLAMTIKNDEIYETHIFETSHMIRHGQVLITPVESRLMFAPGGIVALSHQPWTPPYAPSINDILLDVANNYALTGAIIFSGMGDDAVVGCKRFEELKRPIWTQHSDSCANSSMPDSVSTQCKVNYSGTPEELAMKLAQFIKIQDIELGLTFPGAS